MAEWKSITDAPTDGTYVDLWVLDARGKGARYPDMKYMPGSPHEGSDWEDEHGVFSLLGDRIIDDLDQITHFMSRPTGPTGETF